VTAYRVVESSGSNGTIQFAADGDFSSSGNFVFVTGSERVGIGTPAPLAKLHVSGGTLFGASETDLHQFTGSAQFYSGLSGSLTRLPDGRSYLVAGANVTITSESNGQVTISSTGGGGGSGDSYWTSTQPGKIFTTGSAEAQGGLTGSLQEVSAGVPYLVAGANVSISTGTNGQITISSTGGTPPGCGVYWESVVSGTVQTTGSVAVGTQGDPSQLWINDINITPIASGVIVPGSTLTDTVLLNLSGALSGNQYGSFNIDVIGTTKGITSISSLATAKWNLSVSMLQSSGSFQVVGVTEVDAQRFKGPTSIDAPALWDVNFNASGSLYVNTAGTPTDTSWGAIVTNQTIIDVESGLLFSGKTLVSGSLSSACSCCHDPYWISNSPDVIFTTGSVVIGAGSTGDLIVNGINLTPISGSAVVPGGTSTSYNILSLSGTMSNNQFATFNIDVIGSTKGVTNISNVSTAKRLLTVSMVKSGGQFAVVGITELDAQNYTGPTSSDNASLWDINVDVSGTLYVNTNTTPTDTAWGVIVTKQSVMDVNSGVLIG
jgi:hypothetical protein